MTSRLEKFNARVTSYSLNQESDSEMRTGSRRERKKLIENDKEIKKESIENRGEKDKRGSKTLPLHP